MYLMLRDLLPSRETPVRTSCTRSFVQKSILGKYKEEGNELKKGALLAPKSDSEKALMLSVSRFNGVVENAFEGESTA